MYSNLCNGFKHDLHGGSIAPWWCESERSPGLERLTVRADRAGQTEAGRAAPLVLSSSRRQTLRATNDSQPGAQENHF